MRILSVFVLLSFLSSCGVRVPFTNQLKEEFDLTPENLVKVQFYTSAVIILEKSSSSGNQTTGNDGSLVVNSSKTQDRVIIPAGTKCIFEKMGTEDAIVVRFELGTGKVLGFNTRVTQQNGKYYLVLQQKEGSAYGTLQYGNEIFNVTNGNSTHLTVILKKLQKIKRKDRVVKGLKV